VTLDGLAVIIVSGFVLQISGLIVLARELREVARIGRAVAGLVYQEEEKTRDLIRGVGGPVRPA
jgi:hypothetical protein